MTTTTAPRAAGLARPAPTGAATSPSRSTPPSSRWSTPSPPATGSGRPTARAGGCARWWRTSPGRPRRPAGCGDAAPPGSGTRRRTTRGGSAGRPPLRGADRATARRPGGRRPGGRPPALGPRGARRSSPPAGTAAAYAPAGLRRAAPRGHGWPTCSTWSTCATSGCTGSTCTARPGSSMPLSSAGGRGRRAGGARPRPRLDGPGLRPHARPVRGAGRWRIGDNGDRRRPR